MDGDPALGFGWWPILVMRHWGSVEPGAGYMHTQSLVDRGPFALVRHPQYLAGILLAFGLPLLSQHWLTFLMGAIGAVVTWQSIKDEEEICVRKFRAAYFDYAEKVPRINFIVGFFRWMGRAFSSSQDTPST